MTERLLEAGRTREASPEPLTEVKAQLLSALSDNQPLPLSGIVDLVGDPTWRVSERVALAEQAVWELLHEERLTLVGGDRALPRDRWQPTLLSWSSWIPDSGVAVRSLSL